MAHFLQAGLQLAEQGISASTKLAYNRSWALFCSRPQLVGRSPAEHILAFIAFLHFEKNLAATTVRSHISALAYQYKMQGQPDHTTDFRVLQALRGLLKQYPQRPDRRDAITERDLELLVLALPTVTYSSYEACLFEAAFRSCFAACLRAGEIENCILDTDIVFLPDDSMSFTLRNTKTAKGKPQRIILPLFSGAAALSPALKSYMRRRPPALSPQAPFFRHADGSPLKKSHIDGVLRRAVAVAGITKRITAHCFRIGGATAAARSGLPADALRKLGRWKSERVMNRYIRP